MKRVESDRTIAGYGVVIWLALLVLCFGQGVSSAAYRENPVNNGGTVVGTVTVAGTLPPPPVVPVYLFPFGTYCDKISDKNGNIQIEEFTVGANRTLQDTIVTIENIDHGKPFPEIKADFFATDCMFHPADVPMEDMYEVDEHGEAVHVHPLVSVIRNPQQISVINQDPIFHNSQIFNKDNGHIMLNFPLPVSDKSRGGVLHFGHGRIAQMICGMHEFMQTWSLVVNNPYYDKTKRDGHYTIDRLPPGTYKISAWHPRLKPITKEVTVAANGQATVDFVFDVSTVRRRVFETEAGARTFKAAPDRDKHDEDILSEQHRH